MELEFQNKLIRIINSSDFASAVRTLSLDDRRIIFSLSDFLSHYFVEQCIKRKVYLFNKEEATEMYNRRPDRYAYDMDFLKVAELSDELKVRVYQDSGCDYLFGLDDESKLLDMVAFSRSITRFYFDNVPDSVIEKMVLDPRNQERNKLIKIISCFKNDDYIVKYMTKVPKTFRTLLVKAIKSDEEKIKHIGYFSLLKGETISSISDDVIKEECLAKYSPILLPIEKAQILLSFKDINFLERNSFVLTTENDIFQLFELNYDRIKIPASIIKKIYKEKHISYLIIEGFINADDQDLLNTMVDRIKNQKQLYESFAYCMDTRVQEVILPKLHPNLVKKYVKENMGAQMSEKVLLYIKDDDLLLEALEHFQFERPYSEELLPIFERVAKKCDLNLDHLIALAKISDSSILGLVKNINIRKAINLDEESFVKYLNIFSEKSKSLDIPKINSILTMVLHKSFSLKHPDEIQIFSNTLHDIEDGRIDAATNKIKRVCKWVDLGKYNISELELIEGVLKRKQDVLVLYNKMTHEYLLNARNDYIDQNIENAFLASTEASYERSSALKLFTRVFDSDYILYYLHYLGSRTELTPEEKAFIANEELIRKIIAFKKGFLEYKDFSGDVKGNLRMFDDLVWKTFTYHKHFGRSQFWLLGNSRLPKVPGVGYEFAPRTFDVSYSILQIMAEMDVDKLEKFVFKDHDAYDRLLDYLEKYGMLGWGSCFEKLCSSIDVDLSSDTVAAFISNYPFIEEQREKVVKDKETSIFMKDMSLAMCLDSQSSVYSYLLGEEDYRLVSGNIGPFSSPMLKRERLEQAIEYIKIMHKREYITVPPMDKNVKLTSGKTLNFMIGNTNDPINLTYGERTGACMRIGGAADSLFDFCIKNENGFHISFNNPDTGELVSRVSCFRNGNTLFLNQLRMPIGSDYSTEDVIEACKLMGAAVIEATKNSEFPIVNVVASNGYALGSEKTVGISCGDPKQGYSDFYSDIYGQVVVIATSGEGELQPIKLGPNNAEKYKVGRARVKTYLDPLKAAMAIQRMHVLEEFYDAKSVEEISISLREDIKKSYVGEDWYVAVTTSGDILSYCLDDSLDKNKAIQEMNQYMNLARREVSVSKVISVGKLKNHEETHTNDDKKGRAV